ncbi:MAG: hypothetical protein WBX15_18965 [Thermoanaerobaculia bacterium]
MLRILLSGLFAILLAGSLPAQVGPADLGRVTPPRIQRIDLHPQEKLQFTIPKPKAGDAARTSDEPGDFWSMLMQECPRSTDTQRSAGIAKRGASPHLSTTAAAGTLLTLSSCLDARSAARIEHCVKVNEDGRFALVRNRQNCSW